MGVFAAVGEPGHREVALLICGFEALWIGCRVSVTVDQSKGPPFVRQDGEIEGT